MLSDIHGNIVALEAVLADAARRRVEGFLHLGDLVGYGPRPREVVARVRAEGMAGVAGNYDLAVCHPDSPVGEREFLMPGISPAARRVYRWTRDRVGEEERVFLGALPAQLRVQEGDTCYLFAHGSPERANEYLSAETPERRLRELFAGSGADVLVVGHTHVPQLREVEGRLLLNPGSVGMPKDGDPRAAYAILDSREGLAVERIRVEFDVASVTAESVDFGLPPEQGEAMRLGRGL